MNTMWLLEKFAGKDLDRATIRYLQELAAAPLRASQDATSRMLRTLAAVPGQTVHFGTTPWGEDVRVPLADLVPAVGLITGGMGAGKTMAALLILERIVRLLPQERSVSFGVIDPKGELFERALWLLAWRLNQLPRRQQEELLERIVVIDFASREALSSYNILARWPHAEADYFITNRLETLRDLLPSSEKLSLRGANILKYILVLLSHAGLPITHLNKVLGEEDFRQRLVEKCPNEEVRTYFTRHFAMEGKQTKEALRARMESLFASEGVKLALSGESAPDFRRLQNDGKIVLINCSGPTIARGVRLLLQGLVLSDIRQSIFARPTNPEVTYVWMADEAQNFFLTKQQQENMPDLLNMARAYGSFFHLLCQNLSTAVPDGRILEMLHTNMRWSLTLRGSPNDAAFLKSALPLSGRLRRPETNPFREAGIYGPEEERSLAHASIASLPDREGYLWLKTRSPYAVRLRTPMLRIAQGDAFRGVVDSLRDDPAFGQRVSRQDYVRMRQAQERHHRAKTREDLDAVLAEDYRRKEEAYV